MVSGSQNNWKAMYILLLLDHSVIANIVLFISLQERGRIQEVQIFPQISPLTYLCALYDSMSSYRQRGEPSQKLLASYYPQTLK